MSLPDNDNAYSIGDVTGIDHVVYDGEEVSLLEAFNRRNSPQHDMIDYWGEWLTKDELRNYEENGDGYIDQKREEFKENLDKEFKVVFNTTGGQKVFYLEDNNPNPSHVQERPRSSGFLRSDDGEVLGLRVLRDYDAEHYGFNDVPESWMKSSNPDVEPDDDKVYELQERDFLFAVSREGGLDEVLEQIEGAAPIGRGEFKIAQDNESGTSTSFQNSGAETAIVYDYAAQVGEANSREVMPQFGRYLSTLQALNLGRSDRVPEEFMVSSDGHVYETDQEMFKYGNQLTRQGARDMIVNYLTNMAAQEKVEFNDPREVQSQTLEAYDESDLGDLSGLVPEALMEWDLDEFRDERLL